MTPEATGRRALVDQVLADPPVVHYLTHPDLLAGDLTGVHATDRDCYLFLADSCGEGARTLETGAGLSTVLFAAWGASHECVTPRPEEAAAVEAYCEQRSIPTAKVTFRVGASEHVLPSAGTEPLDLVLIDGGHGFPTPIIDWFYAGARLVAGGVLVLDDVHLPALKMLRAFLDQDPRWKPLTVTDKWAAFERRSNGPMVEDWYDQPFFHLRGRWSLRPVGPAERRLRRALRPLRHGFRSRQTAREDIQSRSESPRP